MGSSRLLIFFVLPILLVLAPLAPTIVGHHTSGACTDNADYCWSCVDNGGMQPTNNASNNGGIYRQNLNTLLSSLTSDPKINPRFYSSSLGQAPDKVNAIAVCRGDVAPEDCRTCFKDSVPIFLQKCADQKKGIIWAQSCTVRYSNISIFGVLEYVPLKNVPSPHNVSNPEQYKQARDPIFENLSEKAAAGDSDLKFAAGNVSVPVTNETIYATVQCSPDLDKQNCSDCLKESISEIPVCCDRVGGGRVLRPSCYLRFESSPF
ncbi:cysteine-rich repeat secretory protein 38-like [Prunus dulcis]|uniref:cysteine-rich repeat secretory protein 38-like n=1 Tax=Prunus dulcis TaxID=3755 RepID=UPI00148205BA|nr:cysteine-rich repeat secretory protein 38-like [Prunus dulcis]XP_034210872.1 cysteine-rich repeat secretory protein 38-like [Prunus dulcis]